MCEQRAHKKCTKNKAITWRCKECRGDEEDQPKECLQCRMRINQGQGLTCITCTNRCHKLCSGITRWREAKGEVWRCRTCTAGEADEVAIERTTEPVPENARSILPGGPCDVCKSKRRKGQGLKCMNCQKTVHVKCAGLQSREQRRRLDDENWLCQDCRDDTAKRLQAPTEIEEVRAPGWKGEKDGTLMIGQWN